MTPETDAQLCSICHKAIEPDTARLVNFHTGEQVHMGCEGTGIAISERGLSVGNELIAVFVEPSP